MGLISIHAVWEVFMLILCKTFKENVRISHHQLWICVSGLYAFLHYVCWNILASNIADVAAFFFFFFWLCIPGLLTECKGEREERAFNESQDHDLEMWLSLCQWTKAQEDSASMACDYDRRKLTIINCPHVSKDGSRLSPANSGVPG